MEGTAMADINSATEFLTMLSALSAAVQQTVDQIFKRFSKFLDEKKTTEEAEARRQGFVHLWSFVVGTAFALSVQMKPLSFFNDSIPENGFFLVLNAVVAGGLTTFGSSFVNEALDSLRNFKQTQEALRKSITPPAGGPSASQ
jgi:hypothetical protein